MPPPRVGLLSVISGMVMAAGLIVSCGGGSSPAPTDHPTAGFAGDDADSAPEVVAAALDAGLGVSAAEFAVLYALERGYDYEAIAPAALAGSLAGDGSIVDAGGNQIASARGRWNLIYLPGEEESARVPVPGLFASQAAKLPAANALESLRRASAGSQEEFHGTITLLLFSLISLGYDLEQIVEFIVLSSGSLGSVGDCVALFDSEARSISPANPTDRHQGCLRVEESRRRDASHSATVAAAAAASATTAAFNNESLCPPITRDSARWHVSVNWKQVTFHAPTGAYVTAFQCWEADFDSGPAGLVEASGTFFANVVSPCVLREGDSLTVYAEFDMSVRYPVAIEGALIADRFELVIVPAGDPVATVNHVIVYRDSLPFDPEATCRQAAVGGLERGDFSFVPEFAIEARHGALTTVTFPDVAQTAQAHLLGR